MKRARWGLYEVCICKAGKKQGRVYAIMKDGGVIPYTKQADHSREGLTDASLKIRPKLAEIISRATQAATSE